MGYTPNLKGGELQALASTVLNMKQNIDTARDIYDMGKEGFSTVQDIYNDMGFSTNKRKSFENSSRNTNVQSSKDKKLRNEYNVPGFSNEIMVLEKVKPLLKRKLGSSVSYDPVKSFFDTLKNNGHVTMNFKFKCDSDIDKRGYHYQIFRHRLSPDNSVNNGADSASGKTWEQMNAALTNDYYNILEPSAYHNNGITGSTNGVKSTATKIITDGQVNHSSMTLTDLEDMSWNLQGLLAQNIPLRYNITGGATSSYNQAFSNFGVQQKKNRQSYPGYWNSRTIENNSNEGSMPKIIPCINNGKVKYSISNKGIYPGKFEIVVFKVKKNKHLSEDVLFYKNGSQGSNYIDNIIKDPINKAVHLRTHARYGTTKLNAHGPVPDNVVQDTTTDPKLKFLPELVQQVAAETYFKEVDRVSSIFQAGDSRTIEIQFGGFKRDPNQGHKFDDNIFVHIMPEIYADETYVLALNYHGLVSSEVVKKGTMVVSTENPDFHDYINGNCFAPSNWMVEADYTEHLQNAEISPIKSSNIFVYGESTPDVFATGVQRLATSIIPQSHTVSTAAHHHTVGSTEGGITNPIPP